jgi:hypothetical protein
MSEKLDRYIEILARIMVVVAMTLVCFALIAIGVMLPHQVLIVMGFVSP